MFKLIQDKLELIISLLSFTVSIFVYIHYRRIAKNNSYNQEGTYTVSFAKRSTFSKQQDISVKIYNSLNSDIIPFDYTISISSNTGGIYRTQMFSKLEDADSIGINKTLPLIHKLKYKKRMPRKYAGLYTSYFSTTPLYPYFCANCNVKTPNDMKLNRYHFYIEISDYCNNTQIWYVSFSLLLSNENSDEGWKSCEKECDFEFFKFSDLNIVSPKDILKNYDRVMQFNKTKDEIKERKVNSIESKRPKEHGFQQMNSDLQLYEMKKYVSFLKELKNNNFI